MMTRMIMMCFLHSKGFQTQSAPGEVRGRGANNYDDDNDDDDDDDDNNDDDANLAKFSHI